MKRLVVIAAMAAAVATLLVVQQASVMSHTHSYGLAYVRDFDRTDVGPLDRVLGLGDGQAYAAIAHDPTLARPGLFRFGRARAAYRFGRPVFGEAVWALSLGRRAAVAPVMAAVCVASVGLAAAALALLVLRRGANPWVAVVVAIIPGAWSATIGLTSEVVALAFAAWAVVLWSRSRRATPAVVALLCLAVLTRETMLLVPVALAVWSSPSADARGRRNALVLAVVPFVALGTWYLVVRLRVGAWPFAGSPPQTLSPVPFAGLVRATAHWNGSAWLVLLLAVVVPLVCMRRAERDPTRAIVVAYAVFAPFMGLATWRSWRDFSRPLLPLCAFAVVAVAGRIREAAPAPDHSPEALSLLR